MLPNKKQLEEHLSEKMTNKDISQIYGVSFQKIIQLIKKYGLNPNKLRRVDKYIVYTHIFEGNVVYVGSGVWYRCRRYTNRRNSEHRQLMIENKIDYMIVAEYENLEEARRLEAELIRKYKAQGEAIFNIKTH